jgi:hypothetical protein
MVITRRRRINSYIAFNEEIEMEIKWVFGFFCIAALTIIQLEAFVLGIDGQIFTATSSIIAALITFLLGININVVKANKEVTRTNMELIEQINKNSDEISKLLGKLP